MYVCKCFIQIRMVWDWSRSIERLLSHMRKARLQLQQASIKNDKFTFVASFPATFSNRVTLKTDQLVQLNIVIPLLNLPHYRRSHYKLMYVHVLSVGMKVWLTIWPHAVNCLVTRIIKACPFYPYNQYKYNQHASLFKNKCSQIKIYFIVCLIFRKQMNTQLVWLAIPLFAYWS